MCCSACSFAATIPMARFLRRPAVARTGDRLTGVIFVAFGIKLALSRAP